MTLCDKPSVILFQIVIDSFKPDIQRTGGLVLIHVVEGKIGRSSTAGDLFNDVKHGRIRAASETQKVHNGQLWNAGGNLGRPNLSVRVFRVGMLPDIPDIKRVADAVCGQIFGEQLSEKILIARQTLNGEDGIPPLL